MRKLKSLSVGTQKMVTEDGSVRFFNYQIIASQDGQTPESYGIKIIDDRGRGVCAPDISTDFEKVRQFADNLYKLSVTPIALCDIAEDFCLN